MRKMIWWLIFTYYATIYCYAAQVRFFIGDIAISQLTALSSDSLSFTPPNLLILLEERDGLTLVRQHLCFRDSEPNVSQEDEFPCVEWMMKEDPPKNLRGKNYDAAMALVQKARNKDPKVRFTHAARTSRVRSVGFFHLAIRRSSDNKWSTTKPFWNRDFRCMRVQNSYRCYLAKTKGQTNLITWPVTQNQTY